SHEGPERHDQQRETQDGRDGQDRRDETTRAAARPHGVPLPASPNRRSARIACPRVPSTKSTNAAAARALPASERAAIGSLLTTSAAPSGTIDSTSSRPTTSVRYTSPASASPAATFVKTAVTFCSTLTGRASTSAFDNSVAEAAPHGTSGAH